jgi:hypothetical protein
MLDGKTLPHLPVKEKTHDGTKEEQTFPCCGKERSCSGEEVSREIDKVILGMDDIPGQEHRGAKAHN